MNNISPWSQILSILSRDDVSEMEITSRQGVWAVVRGKRGHISLQWDGERAFMDDFEATIEPSMHAAGFKRPDKERCIYEGALIYAMTDKNGTRTSIHARLHMMLPPACEFPQVTIAKRSESLTTLESMVRVNTMDNDIMDFLSRAVKTKQTIVFSAGSGGGKTTMLRACCNYLSSNERVIVCEDTPELILPIGNVSYLQSMPWRPGIDQNEIISLEYLVAQANRMRPDRIIVGETRSKEFHGFLQAANSGYNGSMTTLHANSPKECLDRMNMLDAEAEPGRDVKTINTGIAYAIDFIVQLAKDAKGNHWVDQIEYIGNIVSPDNGRITTATVFKHDSNGFKNTVYNMDDRKKAEMGY